MSIQRLPENKLNVLQKKILYTLLFLAIYRFGVHISIPGVDTFALAEFFRGQGANLFGMFNMFSGGALEHFSIFALNVTPYITASIIATMVTPVVPYFDSLSKEGDAGRRKLNQYTRYLAVTLAFIQGYMLAANLERQQFAGVNLVISGGLGWRILTVLSLAAGTAFVMWLGEQITERGVGNGMSLIIFAGIVAGLPKIVLNTYSQYTAQQMDLMKIIVISVICVCVIAGVVFIEQGSRQIPVEYAKRQVGRKIFGGQSSHLPIRINTAGVIPPIFANSILNFPMTIAAFAPNTLFGDFMSMMFLPGQWLYNTVFVIAVIFFAFFYTNGIAFKSDDIAENLKKHGGFIPGVRPGARTSDYLARIVDRLTLVGAIYLAAICVLPTVMSSKFDVQFSFGGTSLLIVVGVALETFRQIEAHRQSLRYEGFLKNTSIRPRR